MAVIRTRNQFGGMTEWRKSLVPHIYNFNDPFNQVTLTSITDNQIPLMPYAKRHGMTKATMKGRVSYPVEEGLLNVNGVTDAAPVLGGGRYLLTNSLEDNFEFYCTNIYFPGWTNMTWNLGSVAMATTGQLTNTRIFNYEVDIYAVIEYRGAKPPGVA